MKIIVSQPVVIEGDRFPHRWHKEFDSDVIPHNGDYVQDTLWEGDEYYKVTEVIIHYELNECYVTISQYETEIPADRKDYFADMANSHEWECSWRLRSKS